MKEFTKKYQVWHLADGNQYGFDEYDTLEECIRSDKAYSSIWYITKRVSLNVTDAEEPLAAKPASNAPHQVVEPVDMADERSELADRYATGPIGRVA